MNFAIRYLTQYRYDGEVVDNLNALRVKPAGGSRQRCDEFTVRLDPEVRLHRHADYFGTEVVEFEVSRPHRHLTIDVRARVVTQSPPARQDPPAAAWQALRDPAYREAGGEFLLQTDPADQATLDELIEATGAAPSPLATLLRVTELIPERFEYRPGATYVDSTIAHLLDLRAGVCQDFVHLGLFLLRHHGIAARYVSGYLYAAPADGRQESIEVDTHAWLEALLPAPDGGEPVWVGADPTNRGLTGETHVKIGHGRHYPDVPPIKGVYRGSASSEHDARVTMTLLTGADPGAVARM